MFPNHSAAACLLAILLSTGDAFADKPAKPGGDRKPKPEAGPAVRGVVQSYDAGQRLLTVAVRASKENKETRDEDYTLASDARVYLLDVLKKGAAPPMGKVDDLVEGTLVTLRLSPEGKLVTAVEAMGPTVQGRVASFDAAKNVLNLALKAKGGPTEQTVELARNARIVLDDGIGKKGDPAKEGKLTDLTEGASVSVQLSVSRKAALSVRIQGENLVGTVKSYDAGTRTLVVTVKEDAQLVDKTYTLSEGAKAEDGLTAGVAVNVRVAASDPAVAVAVKVREDK
jgi:hypothetical protein